MSIAIYLRKSRADMELEAHGEMETLEKHRKILLDYAKKNGLTVTEIYKEIVSGETIAARPVMQRLLVEVEKGRWEGVLVMEIERLARGDTIDQGVVARSFKFGNTKIITPSKTYDPTDEFDEEYFEFGLFMSRREYKTINRRIQRGRMQSAKDGKFLSSTPPFGYCRKKIEDDRGYTLEIIPEEAEVVRFIYNRYASGDGMTVIAAKLDKMGVSPRKRDTWSKSTISDILKNPVYIGKIRWSYRKELKIPSGAEMNVKREINSDCICVRGLHEPIIALELFERVQRLREMNSGNCVTQSAELKNPLSGLVHCKKCGSLMVRNSSGKRNKYATLRCSNRYCDNVSTPLFMVEEKIIEGMKVWLDGYTLELEKRIKSKPKQDINKIALKKLGAELDETEKQLLKAYDLLEKEIYSPEVFTQRTDFLSKRKEEIIRQIEQTKIIEEEKLSASKIVREIIPESIDILSRYFEIESAERRNKLLKTLLSDVLYYKEKPSRKNSNSEFKIFLKPKLPRKSRQTQD